MEEKNDYGDEMVVRTLDPIYMAAFKAEFEYRLKQSGLYQKD